MAKRGALSDLNHDNWNDEEESEEAGKFTQASDQELKKRVIKTARRRMAPGAESSSSSGSGSVFSGFKGFSAVTSTPATKPPNAGSPFSFLSGISKPTNGTANVPSSSVSGSIGSATTSALGASIFATTDPSKKIFSGFGSPPKGVVSPSTGKMEDKAKTEDYIASIKALNQSVAAWVSEKVNEDPICLLTPIFKEYAKYLEEIEAMKKKDSPEPASAAPTGFTVGNSTPVAAKIETGSATAAKKFSFGFGATSSSNPGSSFSFANVAKPAAETKPKEDGKAEDDGEDDEPPKAEFTPVEEKDSIFSKRCKLFVKVEGDYSDRGVGTLHLKKVESKVQVIVRADTNLGNILLNIILNESVPLQRMGKNNVMMICLPTPESKPPPSSVLLRVKTAEEADELYEILNKNKPK
ncbi:nuclear pore complex protein Nup50 [Toxorhynchites rutilus septentrionalis]|uniref:nuclear pore complex protein Nup50 n=1 Tax=Toxorhynchites rutilus septentrionalis TaxID=329112 RepID=UPI0024796CB8|nr:nuclear pore complex protein Nup50 [Toxorhynchites rutilus septentrionalis]